MRSGGDSLPIGGIFLIFNVGGRATGSYLWQGFMFMQAIVKKKKKKKDSSENCPILLFRILMPFFYFNVPFQVALGGTKTFLGRE